MIENQKIDVLGHDCSTETDIPWYKVKQLFHIMVLLC